MTDKIIPSEQALREKLSPEQYHILREHGTERAFTGKYWNLKDDGKYHCAVCDEVLFDAATKYDSGTGWPSFWQPDSAAAVETEADHNLLMARTEVHCHRCGSHLGHVFEDGPAPTGLRYCINSASLDFKPKT